MGSIERLSEAQAARQPDAVAGLALLEERLSNRSPSEVAAFWEAVGRCYGGAAQDGPQGQDTRGDGP